MHSSRDSLIRLLWRFASTDEGAVMLIDARKLTEDSGTDSQQFGNW